MSRAASAVLVLGAFVALVVPSSVEAKLPPGSTFDVCGESACRAASKKESFELEKQLITPPVIQHARATPAGVATWFRVDLDLPPPARWQGFLPGAFKRHFPVAFVPEVESLGVPNKGGAFGWVHLRPGQVDAYTQLTQGLEPFPEQRLAGLDAASVAHADGGAAGPGAGGDGSDIPVGLLLALAGAGLAAAALIAVRARQRRARTTAAA
jgi:hypothetical protein